jgi:hypothetical protein
MDRFDEKEKFDRSIDSIRKRSSIDRSIDLIRQEIEVRSIDRFDKKETTKTDKRSIPQESKV